MSNAWKADKDDGNNDNNDDIIWIDICILKDIYSYLSRQIKFYDSEIRTWKTH